MDERSSWVHLLVSIVFDWGLLIAGTVSFSNRTNFRRVGCDTCRFEQQFEWHKSAIRSPGIFQNGIHRLVVQEKIGRSLRARHVEPFQKDDVPSSIEAGDESENRVGEAGVVIPGVFVDFAFSLQRMTVQDDRVIDAGAILQDEIEVLLKKLDPGVAMK